MDSSATAPVHLLLLCPHAVPLQVSFLLDQLQQVQGAAAAGRHPFAGRPLVILADAAKDDMDAAVSTNSAVRGA
jgi:hypothetical protein